MIQMALKTISVISYKNVAFKFDLASVAGKQVEQAILRIHRLEHSDPLYFELREGIDDDWNDSVRESFPSDGQ